MVAAKKTVSEWVKHLAVADVVGLPLTLEEFQARCLMDIRDNLIRVNQGLEHQESMAVARDETDRKMAQLVGIEPMSVEERVQAIDSYRAAKERVRGAVASPVVDLSSLPPKRDALDS